MVSLILSNRPKSPPNPTLIVAPLSLLSHWEREFYYKTQENRVSVTMYYGDNKASVEELQQYDVVLTTYGTLCAEFNPETIMVPQGLHKVKWFR